MPRVSVFSFKERLSAHEVVVSLRSPDAIWEVLYSFIEGQAFTFVVFQAHYQSVVLAVEFIPRHLCCKLKWLKSLVGLTEANFLHSRSWIETHCSVGASLVATGSIKASPLDHVLPLHQSFE